MARAFWPAEFEWRLTHLRVRDTGAVVAFSWPNIRATLAWMAFYVLIQPIRWTRLAFQPPLRLAFAPSPPSAWYLLWAAARTAGARFVAPQNADAIIYFEDVTTAEAPAVDAPAHIPRLNFACQDVSKSRVAAVFEDVFGYSLSIDPTTYRGPAVEKSEHNGAHDGRVVQCPTPPRPGFVYQRMIDTVAKDGMVEDIRCPTLFGDIPLVFIKRRPVARRFENANAQVLLRRTDDLLSADEQRKLRAFAQAMRLDWGGLDVLRDRQDGRIYVVDVNKTDMGPPTTLPLAHQVRAALRLARALRTALARQARPQETPASTGGRTAHQARATQD